MTKPNTYRVLQFFPGLYKVVDRHNVPLRGDDDSVAIFKDYDDAIAASNLLNDQSSRDAEEDAK